MERQALEYRLHQQSLISTLGLYALAPDHDFAEVAQKACEIAADGVRSRMAKVLRYRRDDDDFVVYAGVGWHEGVVGQATVGAGPGSPAGYAFHIGEPVVSNHLADEDRFRTPQVLVDHGVARAINVIIQGRGDPFGVLEADATDGQRFDDDDTAFLQSLANVLASALERRQAEDALEQALDEKNTLLDELNHRVKNNLQVVSNLLAIETSRLDDPDTRKRLRRLGNRVTLLGRIHNHLYRSGRAHEIELGQYLGELCDNLDGFYSSDMAQIRLDPAPGPVYVHLERAIPLALIINELITNATKHAFPPQQAGKVDISLRLRDGWLVVAVTDNGGGNAGSEFAAAGQGRELVGELAQQIEAEIDTKKDGGTIVTIRVPERALQVAP